MNNYTLEMKPELSLVIPTLSGGGAERMMLNLALELAHRGCALDLVVTQRTGPYTRYIPDGLSVVDLSHGVVRSRPVARAFPRLIRYLSTRNPRVVVSALDIMNVSCVIARDLARVNTAIVVSQRNLLGPPGSVGTFSVRKMIPYIAKFVYPRADHIIAISESVKEDLLDKTGMSEGFVTTIPNPVIGATFRDSQSEPPHPWLMQDEAPVFLAVGRLHPQKDYLTLLKAFAKTKCDPPARLIIIGEGGERSLIEHWTNRLNIADRVDLPGFVDDPFAFMKRATALVVSSLYEGFGNVIVEAMALGTQIIATDSGGPPEILEGGRYGRLVPVGDTDALANAMEQAFQRKHPTPCELRRRAEEFTVGRVADQYLTICERAVRYRSETQVADGAYPL